ncbi:phage Gp37/Gp68 family protein [Caballeronia sordidicola]|uniref:Bacteriophage protein gp37 n=1 Tax=Caballeronia sordidicola TaxID=196367 RepID=A0A242N744_CABSO|nr:phage Gp37/Gp68 family protein [Caballeronia sordidicola]OTP79438.1 Bacteriophage protein gp37 [Caballeronia sordidicola]
MVADSKIEWTDHTFNPWIGCTRVSPGCDHCYAAVSTPARVKGITWGVGEARRRTADSTWKQPKAWNARHDAFFATHGRRQRVFCASLADVFDNEVDNNLRNELLGLIYATPNLDWLLLTKRIGNVPWLMEECTEPGKQWALPPNVWLGATIVNQDEADRDIPKLLAIPARVRFLSMEPLLGPVDLTSIPWGGVRTDMLQGWNSPKHGVHWVIVGGESGADARPMHPDWVRSLRAQCAAASVPFLFKQWGEWTDEDWGERAGLRDTAGVLPSGDFALMSQGYSPPFDDSDRLEAAGNVRLDGRMLMDRVGKRAAGRKLDGVTHDGFPETAR